MSKMKEVASLLGVEIGEEFGVTNSPCTYKITEKAMMRKIDEWGEIAEIPLYAVLSGKEKIIKKPWSPRKGDTFFYVDFEENGVIQTVWLDATFDYSCFALGNCFSTEEEAEKHKDEMLARLQKTYDDGKPLIEKMEQGGKE